jgi:hypothetical protein
LISGAGHARNLPGAEMRGIDPNQDGARLPCSASPPPRTHRPSVEALSAFSTGASLFRSGGSTNRRMTIRRWCA